MTESFWSQNLRIKPSKFGILMRKRFSFLLLATFLLFVVSLFAKVEVLSQVLEMIKPSKYKVSRIKEFTLNGHTNFVYTIAINEDSKYLISGSADRSIKVWNLKEKREECSLIGHTYGIRSVAISKDGKYLISGSEDKSIKFWNLEEKLDEHSLYGHTSNVSLFAIPRR